MHRACRRVCTCNCFPIFRELLRHPLVAYSFIFTFHFARVNLARLWLRSVRCSPRPKDNSSAFFFALHIIFSKNDQKKWTQFGCQIPAPKWGRFLALFHLLVLNNESRSHFGSGIWPQNGSAFLSQRCKKMQPWVPRNDHHCWQKWPLPCHGTVGHSATRTHRLGPAARLQSRHSLAPPSFNNMCTAGPFLHCILRLQTLSTRLPLATMQHC